ncbi:MAG: hypothetical protein AAFX03_06440 [Pseudomonadota bacterium]
MVKLVLAALAAAALAPLAQAQIRTLPTCAAPELAGANTGAEVECVTTDSGAQIRIFRSGGAALEAAPAPAPTVSVDRGVRVSRFAPIKREEIEAEPLEPSVFLNPDCARFLRRDGARGTSAAWGVCYRDLAPLTPRRVQFLYRRMEAAAKRACRDADLPEEVAALYQRMPKRRACQTAVLDAGVRAAGFGPLEVLHFRLIRPAVFDSTAGTVLTDRL